MAHASSITTSAIINSINSISKALPVTLLVSTGRSSRLIYSRSSGGEWGDANAACEESTGREDVSPAAPKVDASHVTPHTSHLTPHTSHLTPHTSHLTPHTSHLTPHTLLAAASPQDSRTTGYRPHPACDVSCVSSNV
jgi:hypothetical protein